MQILRRLDIGIDGTRCVRLTLARGLGARHTIPGMVTMALFADPEGNVIGLVHSETPPA